MSPTVWWWTREVGFTSSTIKHLRVTGHGMFFPTAGKIFLAKLDKSFSILFIDRWQCYASAETMWRPSLDLTPHIVLFTIRTVYGVPCWTVVGAERMAQKNSNWMLTWVANPQRSRLKTTQFVRMGTRHNESERLIVRTAPGSGQALEPNLFSPCSD